MKIFQSRISTISDVPPDRSGFGDCPNCSSDRTRTVGEVPLPVELVSSDFLSVRRYAEELTPSHLVLCDSCKLSYRSRQPTPVKLKDFYVNFPAQNWDYGPRTVGSWCSANRKLSKLYPTDGKVDVLDVGAFNGTFLSGLPTAWSKFAVEPNHRSVSELGRRGIMHIGDFIDDERLKERFGFFDIITMFDVFEHLIHPDVSMSTLVDLLKPGGRLIVSTGNFDHWTWRLLGPRHWYLHTIQHLFVGSRRYFSNYCTRNSLLFESSVNHSHRNHSFGKCFSQSIETLHWWSRNQNGLGRLPASAIQRLPSLNYLIHRKNAPFASGIADHALFVIRKV